MPLDTHEYDLREERDSLVDDIRQLGEEAAEYAEDTPHFAEAEATADRLNNYVAGLEWAIEEWNVDTVTLGTLSSGEFARMQKHIPSDATEQARRNALVGVGTVDAPFVADREQDTIQTVADDVHPYFAGWAERRITELLRGGDEGKSNPFYESLRATTTQETSTE